MGAGVVVVVVVVVDRDVHQQHGVSSSCPSTRGEEVVTPKNTWISKSKNQTHTRRRMFFSS